MRVPRRMVRSEKARVGRWGRSMLRSGWSSIVPRERFGIDVVGDNDGWLMVVRCRVR